MVADVRGVVDGRLIVSQVTHGWFTVVHGSAVHTDPASRTHARRPILQDGNQAGNQAGNKQIAPL